MGQGVLDGVVFLGQTGGHSQTSQSCLATGGQNQLVRSQPELSDVVVAKEREFRVRHLLHFPFKEGKTPLTICPNCLIFVFRCPMHRIADMSSV